MALTTELDYISKNEWKKVQNTTDAFDVQNTSGVLMEYTFTEGVEKGSILLPNEWVQNIEQDIWLKHEGIKSQGTISIVRFSADG